MLTRTIYGLILSSGIIFGSYEDVFSQRRINLTLESAVEIAVSNSFRVRKLKLEIKKTMKKLEAERASLKSKLFMNLKVPELKNISDYQWNLTRYEIVRENTMRWQSNLSLKQPVILLGYPTNGYVSLNHELHRHQQGPFDKKDIDYYNRLYVKFEQPFFVPNELKNDLEEAELDLKESKLDYIADYVEMIEDIADDYYDLFELSYAATIYERQLYSLQTIFDSLRDLVKRDTTRKMEKIQVELEIANVQETLSEKKGRLRVGLANLRQRLSLDDKDSIFVVSNIDIKPIEVDLNQAIENAFTLSPSLRFLEIDKRISEIDLENEKGRNSFNVTLETTYGLEKKHPVFVDTWDTYDNSNSILIKAYIPIWDWGQRRARIEAEKMDLRKRELSIIERRQSIRKNVTNAFNNLHEYQIRALKMKKSIQMAYDLTEMSIEKYQTHELNLQSLLQIVTQQNSTEMKLSSAYLGYRRSLLSLMVNTYFDYEKTPPCSSSLD